MGVRRFSKVILSLTLGWLAMGTSPAAFAAPFEARVEAHGNGLHWQATWAHGEASLVIVGPRGYAAELDFAEASPVWAADGPDGRYHWEIRYRSPIDLEAVRALKAQGGERAVWALIDSGTIWSRVVSGTFLVRDGAVVLPDASPEPHRSSASDGPAAALAGSRVPTKDDVVADDLIVVGRACVGDDCVNGESFEADILRLKQNAVRLGFDDTSISPGFAQNDWGLLANDALGGGADFFAIEDASALEKPLRIDAGAGNDAVRVTSSGDVGFGTATPLADLHAVSGDAPALRLDQDTSMGDAAQAWELTGDETAVSVRDVTGGTTPLSVAAGAADNALVIDAAGDVGVGTASPSAYFHVQRQTPDATTGALIENASATQAARTLFEMKNSGQLNLALTRTDAGAGQWIMGHCGSQLTITKVGTGQNEFALSETGDLTITGGLTAPGIVASQTSLDVNINSGTQASRDLLNLENNGQLNVVLNRTDAGAGTWTLRHSGSQLDISKLGSGVNELSIADNGNLTISGSLLASSGAFTFPDYVFAPEYSLPSLTEVEAFITEHGHLPNVMSRGEVEQQGGIDMTKLQLQTLEKVEELMLYTLEQQRTIEALRQTVEQQGAILDAAGLR